MGPLETMLIWHVQVTYLSDYNSYLNDIFITYHTPYLKYNLAVSD